MTDARTGPGGPPPSAEVLAALPIDDWAALLPAARAGVRAVAERTRDTTLERLLAVPPGRLAGGKGRTRLATQLARPDVWAAVEAALDTDAPRPWRHAVTEAPAGTPASAPAVDALTAERDDLQARVRDVEERLRAARSERDAARDAADRAGRAAEEAAAETARARAAAETAETARSRAAAALADAEHERTRAVERARRRESGAVARLEEDLRAARREVDDLRAELARQRSRPDERPRTDAPPRAASATTRPTPDDGRRGRPTVLPPDLVPGTTPATRWLLDGGVRLLVDGYNVTITNRGTLGLEDQRRWLVDGLATLASRADVDVLVVFDARGGTSRRLRPRAQVAVRFTEPELTADDELVFEVEALSADEPVVVVTDDRGLRDRLAPYGVDLLPTTALLPLLA